MRASIRRPSLTPREWTRIALDDAAALLEYLRARVEEQRKELDTAALQWGDAAAARDLADALLLAAAATEYDETTPEDITRWQLLGAAHDRLAELEGHEVLWNEEIERFVVIVK